MSQIQNIQPGKRTDASPVSRIAEEQKEFEIKRQPRIMSHPPGANPISIFNKKVLIAKNSTESYYMAHPQTNNAVYRMTGKWEGEPNSNYAPDRNYDDENICNTSYKFIIDENASKRIPAKFPSWTKRKTSQASYPTTHEGSYIQPIQNDEGISVTQAQSSMSIYIEYPSGVKEILNNPPFEGMRNTEFYMSIFIPSNSGPVDVPLLDNSNELAGRINLLFYRNYNERQLFWESESINGYTPQVGPYFFDIKPCLPLGIFNFSSGDTWSIRSVRANLRINAGVNTLALSVPGVRTIEIDGRDVSSASHLCNRMIGSNGRLSFVRAVEGNGVLFFSSRWNFSFIPLTYTNDVSVETTRTPIIFTAPFLNLGTPVQFENNELEIFQCEIFKQNWVNEIPLSTSKKITISQDTIFTDAHGI